MYKHILIPLENSPVDEVILRHIRELARMTGARITVIHVAEGYVARSQKSLNLEDSEEMHKDRAYLERRRSELAAEGFEVSTVQVEKPSTGGRAYVVGTVANRLDRPRKAVRIELDLFNATGQKVGVAMDSTPVIEPAGRWQFRAPVIVPEAVAAKLASVREQSPPPGP